MYTIIIDLSFGDTGKGIVSDRLAHDYNYVVRYCGSSNAGHTVIVNGKKIVTHIIPCGIIKGIKSHIGRGCVVSPKKFYSEVKMLQEMGYNTKLISIDENTHLVTDRHIEIDIARENTKPIGSTKQGVSPAYEDKYARRGKRVRDINDSDPEEYQFIKQFSVPSDYLVDKDKLLFEGAQGHFLDVDCDFYPYTTTSHVGANAAAIGSGVNLLNKQVRVIGVFKAYTTSVSMGPMPTCIDESEPALAASIRSIGKEYGATTGRPRRIGWLDLYETKKAAKVNGCTELVLNKSDVLNNLGPIKVRVSEDKYETLPGWESVKDNNKFNNFIKYIEDYLELPITMVGTGPGREEYFTR